MTTAEPACGDAHTWQQLSEDEMTALRSSARVGRPPGAWIDGANRCVRCGAVEARISWFGQVHQVPVAPKQEGGPAVVHWPSRR